MDKKAEQMLKNFKQQINLEASELEQTDAAEFFQELADWSYGMNEMLQFDNDFELQENEE
ncbi:MAG: hypothetical protein PHX61_00975 [Alphaproteobacteria bacterium]|nr:hypothetical protein [Alphaproteobacteria bacterium]